jgi:hypothetical protein
MFGLHIGESGVQGEIMTGFFAVGLIALKIMHGRSDLVAGFLFGANGMNRVTDHQERLERHHDFVVFHKVADYHQDFSRGHEYSFQNGERNEMFRGRETQRQLDR